MILDSGVCPAQSPRSLYGEVALPTSPVRCQTIQLPQAQNGSKVARYAWSSCSVAPRTQ